MTKAAKFLALMPVVALAAACNGVTPTASPGVPTDLSADRNGAVEATGMRATCENIVGIQLDVLQDSKTHVWVEATYQYKLPITSSACPAPAWSADVRGLQVDKANPFRAGFARSLGGIAVVTAVAPNGVSSAVKVPIGGRVATDSCKYVIGVTLTIQPAVDDGRIAFRAQYQYPITTGGLGCSIAPVWEASRRGLTIDSKDGFRASIPVSTQTKTAVTATAPSGAKGDIIF